MVLFGKKGKFQDFGKISGGGGGPEIFPRKFQELGKFQGSEIFLFEKENLSVKFQTGETWGPEICPRNFPKKPKKVKFQDL